jgi:hypothetical protein
LKTVVTRLVQAVARPQRLPDVLEWPAAMQWAVGLVAKSDIESSAAFAVEAHLPDSHLVVGG